MVINHNCCIKLVPLVMPDNVSMTGLCSTQIKVEGIVPKTVWCWGTDRVVNDPLGEMGCTLLYVGLPSALGCVDGNCFSTPCFMGELLNWGLHEI